MRSPSDDIDVTIAEPFAIGRYSVTFDEWGACAQGGGCGGWIPAAERLNRGDRPVVFVSWDDAVAYVRWLSERTGREYRLPSDAEWVYAAAGGYRHGLAVGVDGGLLFGYLRDKERPKIG